VLGGVLTASAQAQQTTQNQPGTNISPQDLAKSVHNPFEDFVKVPLQSTTGFGIGPHHNAGESLNVQPLIPFSLNAEWDLMARPSLSATYQPKPARAIRAERPAGFVFINTSQHRSMDLGGRSHLSVPNSDQ